MMTQPVSGACSRVLVLQDPAGLWNSDSVQTAELFARMTKGGEANCLGDNRWSAVRCPGAARDPALAAQVRVKPAEAVAAPPANGVAAAIKNAAAGAPLLQSACWFSAHYRRPVGSGKHACEKQVLG
jgi:hypothetical protein